MFLEMNNLEKVYDTTTILSNINLSINEGEFVSLLGPSGCGKSTLLSMVAGLVSESSGEIKLQGQVVNKPSKERGMVFQQAALFPWMSVLENVTFPLRKEMKKREAKEKAIHFLQMVQLGNYANHYPHELSGGMQQRVSIARTLAMNPKVLLMDEPFGALDEQTRSLLHKELEDIWLSTGKTILFVTHSIREAIKLSDRIIVMGTRPGKIIDELTVNIPRPRELNKEAMFKLEERVMRNLEVEIKKVAQEELQNASNY